MVRNSLNYVSWKDRKAVAADLKQIYTASTEAAAQKALESFQNIWHEKYPTIGDIWKRHWQGIIPFLSFPDDIRKAIYTTNTIEAINRQIRKIIKTKGAFPYDRTLLSTSFGLSTSLGQGIYLYLVYSGEFGKYSRSHDMSFKVSSRF